MLLFLSELVKSLLMLMLLAIFWYLLVHLEEADVTEKCYYYQLQKWLVILSEVSIIDYYDLFDWHGDSQLVLSRTGKNCIS